MMKLNIYNLDHKFTCSQSLRVGPFTITVNEEQLNNVKKIPRPSSTTFTHDENLERIYYENPSIKGGWENTASLVYDEKTISKSVLLPTENKIDQVRDICNLLTFLTGRRVTVKEYTHQHNPHQTLGHTIPANMLVLHLNNCWKNLVSIHQEKLSIPFINLTYSFESNEFLGMSSYITSTLNAIYDSWWKKHSENKLNKSIKRKIKHTLRESISKSLSSCIKEKLINILQDENIPGDIANDIDKMIKEIGRPSAMFIIEKFLVALDVFPRDNNLDAKKRLQFINRLRNLLVHSGSIPKIPGETLQRNMEISLSTMCICLEILKLYFLEKTLKLTGFPIDSMRSELQKYFESGKFRGIDVFRESYADYMERLSRTWVDEGIL